MQEEINLSFSEVFTPNCVVCLLFELKRVWRVSNEPLCASSTYAPAASFTEFGSDCKRCSKSPQMTTHGPFCKEVGTKTPNLIEQVLICGEINHFHSISIVSRGGFLKETLKRDY